MLKTLANIFSVLLHPMLMPTYGLLLLFFGVEGIIYDYMTPEPLKWRLIIILFVFTFVFPSINIYLLYRFKRVSDLTLSLSHERTYPYLVTALFYFGLFYLLWDVNLWPEIKLFIGGAGVAILITALINPLTKISAHMVGIGGLTGMLVAVSYMTRFEMTLWVALVIVAAGISGASRLFLQAHTAAQVYLGFVVGLLVQVGMVYFGYMGGWIL